MSDPPAKSRGGAGENGSGSSSDEDERPHHRGASTPSTGDSDEKQSEPIADAEADDAVDQIAKEVGRVRLGGGDDDEDKHGTGTGSGGTASSSAAEAPKGNEEEEEEANHIHDYEDTPGLPTLARWIQSGDVSNIVILSGAGVSCSAGIPDFRTPGTGLYDNLAKYNLPYPEAVFDINFYRRNTTPFVSLASEIWPGLRHSPTLTHSFVKLLDDKGLLLRNYTQNIDGLEQLAGVCEERIVECHGHFRTARCVNCFAKYDGAKAKDEIVLNKRAPKCRKCKGPVKPDIVFCKSGAVDLMIRLDLLFTLCYALRFPLTLLIPLHLFCHIIILPSSSRRGFARPIREASSARFGGGRSPHRYGDQSYRGTSIVDPHHGPRRLSPGLVQPRACG